MNTNSVTIPTSVREACQTMHPEDVKVFFRSMQQDEFTKVGELSPSDLTSMQERVKLLKELEHFVLTLQEKPTPSRRK